jgi:hypothetical protein
MGAVVHRAPLQRLLLVVSLAVSALSPSAAHAQATDQRARDLYVQGDRYYAEGRYELAVQAFAESYQLSGRPLLLFNLANALERIGRYTEALDALRRYQPSAPPHEQMALRTRIATLEQRAAQAPPPVTTASSGDSSLMVTGFVVGGAGVALTVVGIAMGVLALDARALAQSGCVASEAGTVCDGSVRGALEEDATFALVADLGVGVGAAALAAGVVLVIIGATSGPSAAPAAAVPYVAPRAEGAEVGVVVAF